MIRNEMIDLGIAVKHCIIRNYSSLEFVQNECRNCFLIDLCFAIISLLIYFCVNSIHCFLIM